ncbi:hypothetical protein LTR28_010140 [Elasticomyces elasticus]|nr:hypothetical protein LTR28_010140 [Elasticomyces elasticus]
MPPDLPRSTKASSMCCAWDSGIETDDMQIVVEKLTKNVNRAHLQDVFGAYGEIKELDLPMNLQFGTNRGTAHILYGAPAHAESAIAYMHEAQLDGAMVSVSIVLPRRRFSTSPPPRRPPPNRFGEPHRYRETQAPPRNRYMGGVVGGPSPPPRGYTPPGRYGGGRGGRDGNGGRPGQDSYRPPARERDRSRSRSRTPRRDRIYTSRSRSPRGGGRARSPSYSSYSSYSDRSRSRGRDGGGRTR